MIKEGVIREGVTPPAPVTEKSAEDKDCDPLEDHVSKRLADHIGPTIGHTRGLPRVKFDA